MNSIHYNAQSIINALLKEAFLAPYNKESTDQRIVINIKIIKDLKEKKIIIKDIFFNCNFVLLSKIVDKNNTIDWENIGKNYCRSLKIFIKKHEEDIFGESIIVTKKNGIQLKNQVMNIGTIIEIIGIKHNDNCSFEEYNEFIAMFQHFIVHFSNNKNIQLTVEKELKSLNNKKRILKKDTVINSIIFRKKTTQEKLFATCFKFKNGYQFIKDYISVEKVKINFTHIVNSNFSQSNLPVIIIFLNDEHINFSSNSKLRVLFIFLTNILKQHVISECSLGIYMNIKIFFEDIFLLNLESLLSDLFQSTPTASNNFKIKNYLVCKTANKVQSSKENVSLNDDTTFANISDNTEEYPLIENKVNTQNKLESSNILFLPNFNSDLHFNQELNWENRDINPVNHNIINKIVNLLEETEDIDIKQIRVTKKI
ncbi:hypothetical protein HANVADRAFT_48064 [Hanseniaspora valbyensis NRRL Y-1626]|uniref:Uncharacterized protein n=1 Tax=Hanseniaspora valbyensis NRRL Y-1626 TaxID=766949 RepID=A0A1B7TGA2_9ASCO|nr:hypothetical protein HANVADRAFT_48064 [Hanseniaspora valbyensis NRRL Y-1626]